MNLESQFITATLVRRRQGFAANPAIRKLTGEHVKKILELSVGLVCAISDAATQC